MQEQQIDQEHLAALVADAEQAEIKAAENGARINDTNSDLPALAAELASCKEELERLTSEKSLVQARHDHLRFTAIPERMAAMGLVSADGKGSYNSEVGKVVLKREIYVAVKAANRPLVNQWLRDNGAGDLIREQVNEATLKAHVKSLKEEGTASIPDFIQVTEGQSVTFIKAKK